ncbi:MAG: glycosyl hydrolase 53 family protein [Bacteroidales bacterium]|nr:glycosyl hydrolase 53 family protein [Bacteroidales bacterium]
MMKLFTRTMALALLAWAGLTAAGCKGGAVSIDDTYWLGADISSAAGMAARGVQLKDFEGDETYELTQLLKNMGLNATRYRVWVNPRRWGDNHAGSCDKEDLLANCLRAKELDMAVMICFHYSDTWADPKHQPIPAAWMGHDYETMKQDLYDYTVEVLSYLKENGVEPKWIQIGNETRNGLLWNPARRAPGEPEDPNNVPVAEHMGHSKLDPEQYAGFIDAGHKAAKSVFPKAITIVHLDNGYDSAMYDWNLGLLEKYGTSYDMVGMSLYPYWAAKEGGRDDADGVIDDCIANIKHVYERFGKESMIVETGFEVNEAHPEIIEESYRQFSKAIRDSRDLTDGHCHGIFYWAPESRPGGYSLGAFGSDSRPTKIMKAFVEAAEAAKQK